MPDKDHKLDDEVQQVQGMALDLVQEIRQTLDRLETLITKTKSRVPELDQMFSAVTEQVDARKDPEGAGSG